MPRIVPATVPTTVPGFAIVVPYGVSLRDNGEGRIIRDG
jgi:hypothetical protein